MFVLFLLLFCCRMGRIEKVVLVYSFARCATTVTCSNFLCQWVLRTVSSCVSRYKCIVDVNGYFAVPLMVLPLAECAAVQRANWHREKLPSVRRKRKRKARSCAVWLVHSVTTSVAVICCQYPCSIALFLLHRSAQYYGTAVLRTVMHYEPIICHLNLQQRVMWAGSGVQPVLIFPLTAFIVLVSRLCLGDGLSVPCRISFKWLTRARQTFYSQF